MYIAIGENSKTQLYLTNGGLKLKREWVFQCNGIQTQWWLHTYYM